MTFNIDEDDAIKKATDLKGEPISKCSLNDIVHKFEMIPNNKLAGTLLNTDNADHFKLNFINQHQEFIYLNTSKKVRICHNLSKISPTTEKNVIYIYLHGLGGSLDQFLPLLKLTELYHIPFLAIDLFGFGQSDELDQYNMIYIVEKLHDILIKILTRFQINSKLINLSLIGHSAGCYLSLHFLTKYISQWSITNVILLAPPSPNVKHLDKTKILTQAFLKFLYNVPSLFTFYREWFDQSKGLHSSGINKFFHQLDSKEEEDHREDSNDNLSSRYLRLFQFYNNIQIKSRTLIGYLLGWEPLDWKQINEIIKKFNIKITIFCGELDTITDANECAVKTKESFITLSNKQQVELNTIPNCSHNITFDAPKQICKLFADKFF
ncbi:hypothetical protein RI543_003636 [Arxiozyma heterogenica]|uniref:AB hydrolase-1 domain-containing protein n=1 Tax=Arxiozyma heterogenica TaxID=278026 RepID=A0AAN7W1B3_9SACH|nr:hypothetical protein RI543_003636 [Kazachstania heterogenica]